MGRGWLRSHSGIRCSLGDLPPSLIGGGALYEVRPRKDHRDVDPFFDALPFGGLWYGEPDAIVNAIGYAMLRSCSHDAVIRMYDATGNVIEMHEHGGDFKEW